MKIGLRKFTCMITAALLLSMAVGCSGEKPAAEVSNNESESLTASQTETTTEKPEYVPDGTDYDGAEIPITSYQYASCVWKVQEYCEAFSEAENGDPINDALYTRNNAVEDALNVDIKVYPIKEWGSTSEVTKAVMAGEDAFKFSSISATSMVSLLNSNNMFTDLGDIPTLSLSASWWNQNSVEEFTLFDTTYAVVGDLNMYSQLATIVNYLNKTMVSEYKLNDPYELVRNGSWTLDKMIEMAHAATIDLNGNGEVDVDDSFGFMGEGASASYFLQGAGIRYSERNSDNIPEISINTERTVNFTEKFITFINEPDTVILDGRYKGYNNLFFDLMLPTFKDNRGLFFSNQLLIALDLRDMETDFGILPLPKLDEDQKEYYNTSNNSWQTVTSVPVTNTALEMTGDVLNAMGFYSQQIVTQAVIDTTIFNKALRDDDSAEMLDIIYDTQTYDIAGLYNWGGVRTMFSDMTQSNDTAFASKYAKSESKIIENMNKTLETLSSN